MSIACDATDAPGTTGTDTGATASAAACGEECCGSWAEERGGVNELLNDNDVCMCMCGVGVQVGGGS